ncbi:hypothetical protein WKH87_08495 [Xanthomonas oryzae pv. oryzae]
MAIDRGEARMIADAAATGEFTLLRSGVEVSIDQKMPREMRWPLRCVLRGMVYRCDEIYTTHVRHISAASVL